MSENENLEEVLSQKIESFQKISVYCDGNVSPIDINIVRTNKIILDKLTWTNYNVRPKKMKITNNGKTLILSAKWNKDRPFICGGCLEEKYILSQIHFHWGDSALEGSEHSIESSKQPLEMHLIHFKDSCLNQKEAIKDDNGIVCVVYMFQFRSMHNPVLHRIVSLIKEVIVSNTSVPIVPFSLTDLIYTFENDYFMYAGSIANNTADDLRSILWLISRDVLNISFEQLILFRQLLNQCLVPIYSNYRQVKEPSLNQLVFHVNPINKFTNSTLSPIPLNKNKLFTNT